jgi:class 3 adenylate cyclase
MIDLRLKSFAAPYQTIEFPLLRAVIVEFGDFTVGCGEAIRDAAARHGPRVRAGVHVGEVEFAGGGLRAVALHEASRIMGKTGAGEILVSEMTRALVELSGFAFDDRGPQRLRGLEGERRLYAFRADRA